MDLQELLSYWHIIRKRLWLIGVVVAVTAGTVALISYLAKPIYRASMSFQVTVPLPTEVSLTNEFRTTTSREELVYTQSNFIAVLKSEFVAGEVINRLGLEMDPSKLQSRIIIEPDANSDFISLKVTAQNPQQAAAIANTLTEIAAQYFAQLSAGSFTASREFIQGELQATKQELDAAKAALVQFQIDHRVGSLTGILDLPEHLITVAMANRDTAIAEGKTAIAAQYDRIIAGHEKELQERVQLSAEYEALQSEVQHTEGIYQVLLDKEAEARLKENEILSAKFVRVIPAREPTKPLPRLDARILLLSAAASLVVGVGLAFVLEYLENAQKVSAPRATPAPTLQTSWETGKD